MIIRKRDDTGRFVAQTTAAHLQVTGADAYSVTVTATGLDPKGNPAAYEIAFSKNEIHLLATRAV